ncbi:MAG: ABC-2 type transport system permease protein [Alteromonadaceae bacterium]|jgi:ABC-2 type transport system permease protein
MHDLFIAECKRLFMLQIRYPLEFVSGIFMLTFVFYSLVLGIRFVAGDSPIIGGRIDMLVVGYISWLLVSHSVMTVTNQIADEAKTGTLEGLLLSYHSPGIIFLLRSLVSALINGIKTALILLLVLLLTDVSLNFNIINLLPLITMILAAIGLGLIAGGATLLLKRTQTLLAPLQFLLMFVVMTPFEQLQNVFSLLSGFLPILPSVMLLRQMMVTGMEPAMTDMLLLLLNAGVYLTIGILVFGRFVAYTKRKGAIADY